MDESGILRRVEYRCNGVLDGQHETGGQGEVLPSRVGESRRIWKEQTVMNNLEERYLLLLVIRKGSGNPFAKPRPILNRIAVLVLPVVSFPEYVLSHPCHLVFPRAAE